MSPFFVFFDCTPIREVTNRCQRESDGETSPRCVAGFAVACHQCARRRDGPALRSRWRPVRSRSTRTSRTSRWTSCARDPTVRARLPFPSPDAIAPAPLPDVRLTSLAPTPRVAVFELAKMRPAYGVGSRFARARWEERGAPDSFWTVTRMKPRPSGRSGSAWGFLTWKGKARPGVTRIPKAQTPGIWKVLEEESGVHGPALSMPQKEETESEGEEK